LARVAGPGWDQFLVIIPRTDLVAKVIYGVMITKVAVDLSRAEGYDPALAKAD
jgi:hypothetical protein